MRALHPMLLFYRVSQVGCPCRMCRCWAHNQGAVLQCIIGDMTMWRQGVRVHRPSTIDLLEGVVLVLGRRCEVVHKVHVGTCSGASHSELSSLEVHSGAS